VVEQGKQDHSNRGPDKGEQQHDHAHAEDTIRPAGDSSSDPSASPGIIEKNHATQPLRIDRFRYRRGDASWNRSVAGFCLQFQRRVGVP
ncbi:MAG: hypothetical protein ACPGJE_09865, partial [Wenzhouxiangellaceae bacterium]